MLSTKPTTFQQKWNELKCALTNDLESYSVVKKMKYAGKWVDLEKTTLNEATQTQKNEYYIFFKYRLVSNLNFCLFSLEYL